MQNMLWTTTYMFTHAVRKIPIFKVYIPIYVSLAWDINHKRISAVDSERKHYTQFKYVRTNIPNLPNSSKRSSSRVTGLVVDYI